MENYFQKVYDLEVICKQEAELKEMKKKLEVPLLTDKEYIPMIIKWICELSAENLKSDSFISDIKKVSIFIILYLYSPISLASRKMESGFRSLFAKELAYKSPSGVTNHLTNDLLFQHKQHPIGREIDRIYPEIIKRLKEKEIIP
ncbi:hypothetical protein [uncultured Bacteroides sp.]|uniref:hypothetical protein n=1 Tax=uncultured Bacteroides sp. TaxID=162156 RepID=UPI0025CF57F7|nr:hypothetical protein [uncultured Bacteroides sp.]